MESSDPSGTPFRVDGEVALITGGSSGLGLSIARCLVQSGASVIITGRKESALAAAVAELGASATYRVHDVSDLNSADQLIEGLDSPPSILVNNAGTHLKKGITETTHEDFLHLQQVHVHGGFALARAAATPMKARRHGSILFIASMASLIGLPQTVAYSAAKSACVGMTRCLAAELGGDGVRVNAIAPGWMQTPMLDRALHDDDDRRDKILGRTPLRQFGNPDDIGWAAVYLSSPAARFVTGVVLPVDGGASIGF